MAWTMGKYRIIAMVLWGLVSVSAGLSVGFYFNMSEKKILFVVVVAVGLYVLVLLRMFGKEEGKERGTVNDKKIDPAVQQVAKSRDEKNQVSVADINESDSNFADDEAREWLDDFLVKQQRDV